MAYLEQAPVTEAGGRQEFRDDQGTVISAWTLLVLAPCTLTSESTVTDSQGRQYRVVGDVADRPHHRPKFRAAALRLISDLQPQE